MAIQAEASAKRAEQAGTAAEARAQRAEQRLTEAEQQLQEQRGAARQLQQRVTSLETQMQAAAQRLVRVRCSSWLGPPSAICKHICSTSICCTESG